MIFFLKQSLNGLFKNGVMSSASILFLVCCLVLMGSFSLLIVNLEANMDAVNALNLIIVFVDNELDDDEISELNRNIRNLENVKNVTFIPREEGIAIVEDWLGADNMGLREIDENIDHPIRNVFEIEYVYANRVATLLYHVENLHGVARVRNEHETAQFLFQIRRIINLILISFLVILFIATVFIVLNTVKLSVFARRNEITLMRYIGATNDFILMPFLIEGALIGVIAAVIAFFIEWYIYRFIMMNIANAVPQIVIIEFSEIKMMVFLSFIVAGTLSGLIGSAMSARKYLKA